MMKLACKDINPSSTCEFVAEGETAIEAAEAMIAHAKVEHPEDIKGMADLDLTKEFEIKAHV